MRRAIFLCFPGLVVLASLFPVSSPSVGIRQALAAAQDGDTIQISAGMYSGSLNCDLQLTKNNLKIIGIDGPEKTVVDCLNQTRCLSVLGVTVTISGISFVNGRAPNTPVYVGSLRVAEEKQITARKSVRRPLPRRRSGAQSEKEVISMLRMTVEVGVRSDGSLKGTWRISSAETRGTRRKGKAQGGTSIQGRDQTDRESGDKMLGLRAVAAEVSQSFGGCILVAGGANATLVNVRVRGGQAVKGGGVAGVGSLIELRDSEIKMNGLAVGTSDTLTGGGGYFVGCRLVNVTNSDVTYNVLTMYGSGNVYGAGLFLSSCGAVFLSGVRANDNSIAGYGTSANMRGAGLYASSCGSMAIEKFIGSRNSAESAGASSNVAGGAVYLTTIQNVTIAGIVCTQNWLKGAGSGAISGAGMYGIGLTSAIILRSALFQGNSVQSLGAGQGSAGAGILRGSVIVITGTLEVSDNIIVCGDGGGIGAGIIISMITKSVTIESDAVVFRNNSVSNIRDGAIRGAGLYVESVPVLRISATRLLITDNKLQSAGSGLLQGAGFFVSNCDNVSITADLMIVSGNSAIGTFKELRQTAAYQTVETNSTQHCAAFNPVITNTLGLLTDGGSASYSPKMDCMWTLSAANNLNKVFGRFNVTLLRVDTEGSSACSYDYVSLYDGPSTRSPLLGTYCGSATQAPICSKGACMSPSSILTSGSQLTVTFHSDASVNANGFALQWTSIQYDGSDSGEAGILPDATQSPSLALGGGMAFLSTFATIRPYRRESQLLISGNTVRHPIHASGAGIATLIGGGIEIYGALFDNNRASSFVASGGALVSFDGSLAVLEACSFTRNSAVGTGRCFVSPVDQTLRCATAIGGAVSAAVSGSWAEVRSSTMTENSVSCEAVHAMCSAHGGAMGVTRTGRAAMWGVRCESNVVKCEEAGCVFGSGGCLSGDSGGVNVSGGSVFKGNAVVGTGGGGAVVGSGDDVLTLRISDATIESNTAAEGGGVWCSGNSNVVIWGSLFLRNNGTSVAGAIAATENAVVEVRDCALVNNIAGSRGSAILAFNDNNKGKYTLSNVTMVVADAGNAVIMVGQVRVNESAMECTSPGTALEQDLSSGFFSQSCVQCKSGSYAVEGVVSSAIRKCQACPYGANCTGATATSNGLLALPTFWGSVDSSTGIASFYQCPSGFCCPMTRNVVCNYNYCQGGRVGRLCGACPEGSGFVFFAESCRLVEKCKDAKWAVPVIIIGAVTVTLFLLLTTEDMTSTSLLAVVLFYYQVLPLVKSTPWKYTSALFTSIMQSVTTASSNESGGSSGGVCIVKGMTSSGKIGLTLLFQGAVSLGFLVVYVAHVAMLQHPRTRSMIGGTEPTLAMYLSAISRFLLVAYTSLVLKPLQMLQCVWIDGSYVWWWDANVECYAGFQVLAIIVVCVLSTVPMAMIYVLQKWKHEEKLNPWQRQVRLVMSVGTRNKRRWWIGISMYRRLMLVLSFTMITDGNWRSIVTTVLCMIYLALHIAYEPWDCKTSKRLEIIALSFLGVLSATSAPQLAHLQFGSPTALDREAALEALQFTLAIIPIAFYVPRTIGKTAIKIYRHFKRKPLKVETEMHEIDDFVNVEIENWEFGGNDWDKQQFYKSALC